jgi:hypothetical protein
MTSEQSRTAAANKARTRAAGEKKAAWLRERGWVCIPPEEQETDRDS